MSSFDERLIDRFVSRDKRDAASIRLKEGYPIQYIIGNVDFYGINIDVNEKVLIPRFETEYLVDDLIKLINKNNFTCPNILDIGTGSGNISIALKKNLDCNITAIDVSKDAISVAKKNAAKNDVKISFKHISIEDYSSSGFDILVSNPPYVKKNSKVDEKIKYEPQNAIYADDNGLYFYKVILNKCKSLLNEKNIIAF